MRTWRLGVCALFVATVLAPASYGQHDPCLNRTFAVNVYADNGDIVQGLDASNFRAKLGKKPVEIISATFGMQPRRIVIVLDESGSMDRNWKMETDVARRFVLASPSDSFALLTFATTVMDRVDFDKGNSVVLARLERLEAKDREHYRGPKRLTALRDALGTAPGMFQTAKWGDSIFLISDGGENASKTKANKLKAMLVASGVRLFALIPLEGRGTSVAPVVAEGADTLRELAADAGGDCVFLPIGEGHALGQPPTTAIAEQRRTKGILRFVANGFDHAIDDFYKLEIKLPEPLKKSRHWKLEVVTSNGKARPHTEVIYPRSLAACR